MVDINLAVVSGRRIIQAENLQPNPYKPVNIQAVKGAHYVLVEGESLTAPDTLRLKRVGNDLQVIVPGGNAAHPGLVIENYYSHPGELVGIGEDDQWHAFTAASADHADDPDGLQDGEGSTVLLDSDIMPPLSNLEVDSNIIGYGVLAIGAAASVAALAILTRSNSDDKSSTPPPPEDKPQESSVTSEEQPAGAQDGETPVDEFSPMADETPPNLPDATFGSILDDVGGQQGALLPNEITGDNKPTLSGSDQLPGSIIEIRDNDSLLGTTSADADGNWSLTPFAALPNGTHAFVVVVTDPAGVVSAPSDPAIIIIDAVSEVPAENPELGALLPEGSDLSDWAQSSLAAADTDMNSTPSSADDVSRLVDDLLGNHPFN